jgi:FlaA1/EpsC-like NDP-sugar epimerase
VFGAGDAGHRLVGSMTHNKRSDHFAVLLLDDDQTRQPLSVDGIRARGTP